MASTYLKLDGVTGPVDASGSTAVPGGQANGFSLAGVFDVEYSVTSVSGASSIFGGTGGGAGVKPVPSEMQLVMSGTVRDPDIWLAAAKATVFPRGCVIVAASATGGVAQEWVRAYYVMRNVMITSYRTVTDDGASVFHEVGLSYNALFSAYFATPSGGVLGARTQQGWDFVSNSNYTP